LSAAAPVAILGCRDDRAHQAHGAARFGFLHFAKKGGVVASDPGLRFLASALNPAREGLWRDASEPRRMHSTSAHAKYLEDPLLNRWDELAGSALRALAGRLHVSWPCLGGFRHGAPLRVLPAQRLAIAVLIYGMMTLALDTAHDRSAEASPVWPPGSPIAMQPLRRP
jgi:hypothetical protein